MEVDEEIFAKLSKLKESGMASDSATYTYDSLGRLTQITYANGTIIVIHYDPMGNRTSVVTTCGSGGC
jgi:YD repeat-containing protein